MRLVVVRFVAALAMVPLSVLAQGQETAPAPVTVLEDAPAPGAAPEVAALKASGPITLDGTLDETAWQNAGEIPFLTQQDPKPGGKTPFDATRVLILADGQNLYFGVVCPDPEPDKIVIHTMERDAELRGEDVLTFVLDTFGDRRTGYLFSINAGGARQDGLILPGEDVPSFDWDGIWDARARRTPEGWVAEIAVSARSLRFRPGLTSWGLNFERYLARERTTLRWSGLSLDARLPDLRRAGQLFGVYDLGQGKGLSVAPYAVGRANEERISETGQTEESDIGLDLSYNFTPELGAVLTVNTDFAETEVDTRQINLTRFPLFFPEKRSFFLEGSNLFAFGSALAPDFIPFYSRRVGLAEGQVVPIDAGLKLLGRAGPWSIAALDVQTGDVEAAESTNLFAGRVSYDLGEHLRLGTLYTRGDPLALDDNSFAGVDAQWRTSTFRKDKNLFFAGWAGQSSGDLAPGQSDGWGVRANYPNDLLDLYFEVNEYGEALDPALGFLPRPGTRQWFAGSAWKPRPQMKGALGNIRQLFFELFLTRIDRLDGTTESWEVFTTPLNAQTHAGDRLEFNWVPRYERLDLPFPVAQGVVIPTGEYRFDRWRVQLQTTRARPWRVDSTVWFGDFYTGQLTQVDNILGWTFGPGRLRLELESEINFGDLPEGDFVQRLWQLKAVWGLSPNLFVSSFFQYDSESRDLGVNTRLRWTLQPGRDLFVVWNRNWLQDIYDSHSFAPNVDQFAIKLRWTKLW